MPKPGNVWQKHLENKIKISLHLATDTITPDLRRRLRKVENPGPALRGAGQVVVSMAKDAFTNPDLRPTTWKGLEASTIARKGTTSPLIASGDMARSPRIIAASKSYVKVGSHSRAGAYSLAGIHQLGAPRAKIPPRPFFPFFASGEATATAKSRVREVLERWLKML